MFIELGWRKQSCVHVSATLGIKLSLTIFTMKNTPKRFGRLYLSSGYVLNQQSLAEFGLESVGWTSHTFWLGDSESFFIASVFSLPSSLSVRPPGWQSVKAKLAAIRGVMITRALDVCSVQRSVWAESDVREVSSRERGSSLETWCRKASTAKS